MSLSSTNHYNEYAGDDATTSFAYSFKVFDEDDLRVMLVNDTTQIETLLTKTTHYTVTGEGLDAGGTVEMVTAPATGETLIIGRVMSFGEQPIDLQNQGSLPPESLEEGLDRLAMYLNQVETRGLTPTFTTAARPTPCSYWGGRSIRIKDAGSPGHLETCLNKDDGSWWWLTSVAGPV